MDNEQQDAPVEQAEAPKKKAKAPSKTRRVEMRNTRPDNGEVGATAAPLEKDVPAWESAGWVRT